MRKATRLFLNFLCIFADIRVMSKKQKILLVEDDKKFGESLFKILTNEGFECIHAEKPQTALSLCKVHNFDIAIIDCMLPQMNGVDLALKIKETAGTGIVLYMMSGIYKDRNFSVSALKKTGAKSFLIKPFEVSELLGQLKVAVEEKKPDVVMSDDPIKNFMLQEEVAQAAAVTALTSKKTLLGYEVAQIFTAMQAFKLHGRIHLRNADSLLNIYFGAAGVSLARPLIAPATLKDFITAREYLPAEDLVSFKSDQISLKQLCELNLMSPHFAEEVEKDFIMDQLNVLVGEQQYSIEYFKESAPPNTIALSTRDVDDLLQSWIGETINITWIKNFYAPYLNNTVKKASTTQNKIQTFPLISAHKHIVQLMMSGKNIMEIVAESGVSEEITYRVIHLMMVYREFTVSLKKMASNSKAQAERLRNLLKSFDNHDAFEKLGLTSQANDNDIKKAYQEFSSTLHPDKLVDANDEIKQLSHKVYEHIQVAYNALKTPEKRQAYLKEMANQKQADLAEAVRVTDHALNILLRGDLSNAAKNLAEAATLAPHLPRLKILQAWIGLKTGKMPVAQTVKLLQTLPNDERETAVYHYVKGLQNQASGEHDKALVSFKNAIAKDANFLPARRELTALPNSKDKPKSILQADLKDVVGMFFKKK